MRFLIPRSLLLLMLVMAAEPCAAQTGPDGKAQSQPLPAPQAARGADHLQQSGTSAVAGPARVQVTERLKIGVEFLAGYGHDGANAPRGFENQGRVGYVSVTLEGKLNDRVSYRIAINPIAEVEPVPGCGEPGFFYPNVPGALYSAGPQVPCEPKYGSRRVDLYRGIALDALAQQGPLREGFMDFRFSPAAKIRAGRFILPIGFYWEDAGALTAKDATTIQRINAEANFGALFSYTKQPDGRTLPLFGLAAGAILGDGNRWKDYDYFYFEDGSLDSNSALTAIVSGSYAPVDKVEVRAAYKKGYTGSKVERLPSYWASKRTDDALVVGARVTPASFVTIFGEYARYVWGPTRTSAEMLGIDPSPIVKPGYYVGIDLGIPIGDHLRVGGAFIREELSRDDSLVKYLEINKLYGVTTGKRIREHIYRVYVDWDHAVTVGFYRNDMSNPFPWVSGIWPVAGPGAFTGKTTGKYGVAVRFRLR